MTKLSTLATLLLLPAAAAAVPAGANNGAKEAPVYFRYAAKAHPKDIFRAEAGAAALRKSASEPTKVIEGNDYVGYLDAPDGSIWYYTVDYITHDVAVNPNYTEHVLDGYTYTIYNSKLEEVGTVTDKITLGEHEIRVPQIQISPTVSQKFFNYDNKYEIVVSIAVNKDSEHPNPYPYVDYHSKVYSIGGEKDADGNDVSLMEFSGYEVASINGTTSPWNENYYYTFLTEEGNIDAETLVEFANSCKNVLTTYKRASYAGGPSVINQTKIPLNNLPGDQQTTAFFWPYMHGDKPMFALSYYEKPFLVDPVGLPDENGNYNEDATPDNHLIIKTFSVGSDSFVEESSTAVPTTQITTGGAFYTYYSVGELRYTDDIDYTGQMGGKAGEPTFTVCRNAMDHNENSTLAYIVYDKDGNALRTIVEGISDAILLSDVKGFEPQMMCVYTGVSGYTFEFVDLYSGSAVTSVPQQLGGQSLTAAVDRVPYGTSYRWVFQLGAADTDTDGNTYHQMGYVTPDGELERVDRINIGQNVAYAQVFTTQTALTPYVFNTDDKVEYMVLVKRYLRSGSSQTREEFMLATADGDVLLHSVPDETSGPLYSVNLINLEGQRVLCVMFNKDSKITQHFYELPLSKFAKGGDGSETNPYLISSVADLQQMQSYPASYFKLACDIDASGFAFAPIKSQFTGHLDGDGHTVSHLAIDATGTEAGIFIYMHSGANVKNINFRDAVVYLNDKISRGGLIAANTAASTYENIHVYGLTVEHPTAEAEFGGLFGRITGVTKVSGVSVANALIDLPASEVGGLVCAAATGSKVTAGSFIGTIKGGSPVGGIMSSTMTGDEEITDCHVDAKLSALNTVGGIIGSDKRSLVERCYVEGEIEATDGGRFSHGPKAGGIVGELMANYDGQGNAVSIKNCYVALSELKGFKTAGTPEYAQKYTTIHRIAGWTSYNGEPEPSGYDDQDNPIYEPGAAGAVETGFEGNYAIASLAAFAESTGAGTTEGETIADDAVDTDFFTARGFKFGNDIANPWNAVPAWDPSLYHEIQAYAVTPDVTTEEGLTFTNTIVFISRATIDAEALAGGFTCESTDEEVAMPTGNGSVEGNALTLEFASSKVGTAVVTVSYAGMSASFNVDAKVSGIENTVVSTSGITYDGRTLRAEGSAITLYTVSGVAVARGSDAVGTESLAAGVYIARAIAADGSASTIKIAVK